MQEKPDQREKAADADPHPKEHEVAEFVQQAEEPSPSLVAEFVAFIREHKAWWLVPILLALALMTLAVWLGGSPLAPFIYPLF
ncbi:MAG: DUF5989 family protein [Planctomycetota bacterium]